MPCRSRRNHSGTGTVSLQVYMPATLHLGSLAERFAAAVEITQKWFLRRVCTPVTPQQHSKRERFATAVEITSVALEIGTAVRECFAAAIEIAALVWFISAGGMCALETAAAAERLAATDVEIAVAFLTNQTTTIAFKADFMGENQKV